MSEINEAVAKKILIVDDEPTHLALVKEYLSSFGYDIYTALDGKGCLEMLQKVKPDLALLDINLPDMDGFQLIKKIKEIPCFATLPVVFLSGYDRSNFKVKALELGADDYITRPFNTAELLARLRAVLRRSESCKCDDTDAMTGNLLDHMGLVELLQPLEIGKRTAFVKLKDIDAELVIEKGVSVYMRQGKFTGLDALDRILLGEKGRFSIAFTEIPANFTKQPVQLTKAIMDSISYLDEVKSLLHQFIPADQLEGTGIVISPEIKALPGTEKFKEDQVVPAVNLIMTLPGDLKDVVQNLLNMFKNNMLKLNTGLKKTGLDKG